MTDPWARPGNPPPHGQNPPTGAPSYQPTSQYGAPQQGYPAPPPGGPTQTGGSTPPPPADKGSSGKRMFRDPLSLTLVVVIVAALALAGLVGAELYARHLGNQEVARATECVVQDSVDVSFGARPFLLQHLSGHYSGIHITTAGNRLREAKGMKADIVIDDVRVADGGNSAGTIGSMNATVTWSSEGITQTIQDSIPLIGSFVNGVTTDPSDGTVQLEGALGDIVAKPRVVDGAISLEVVELTGLGFTLPREAVQPALDVFTAQLTKDYPLALRADSIEVTDSGIVTKLSAQNATMPAGGQGDDACFSGI
ncbi:LmeA family phospholipid-binding protein [Mycolicibacterium lacusdiani]|uniref:LmeA family phospholipid-binding protein n=1 Tax=Mycolicibacterium lacusdiani TaxID=2895283 RepID=UPI001F348719|nr:DUF2993 domain-containing protein [Mycolicibacterium lacusdiani]